MGQIRVLVADDDPAVRALVTAYLAAADGISIVGQARNGKEAVELTSALRPDVVLMDFTMPQLDGIEATRQIVAAHPDSRVVGLSVHDQALGDRLCDAGAVTYLTKDSGLAALLDAVRFAAEREINKPR